MLRDLVSALSWEMGVGGVRVPRVEGRLFPYCGLLVDVGTLEVGKERDWGVLGGGDTGMFVVWLFVWFVCEVWGVSNVRTAIFNSLTVEFSRCPGMNFKRKVLSKSFFVLADSDTSHTAIYPTPPHRYLHR